jgi:hypothetical protein
MNEIEITSGGQFFSQRPFFPDAGTYLYFVSLQPAKTSGR